MKILSAISLVILLAFAQAHAQDATDIPRLKKAANAGDSDAAYELGVAYEFGIGVPRDPGNAGEWYGVSEKYGNKQAAAQRRVVNAERYAQAHSKEEPSKLMRPGILGYGGTTSALDPNVVVAEPTPQPSLWQRVVTAVNGASNGADRTVNRLTDSTKQFFSENPEITDTATDLITDYIQSLLPGGGESEGTTSSGHAPRQSNDRGGK
jgi:hypothetical protein